MSVALSVLDLVPVAEAASAAAAVRNTVELARLAEQLGFVRYWFAEHHSMGSVASAAPEVLIGYVAGATQRIRVGSGGIMLPNHAPLRVAEAFRTLSALYPRRIDLGIGRAPGADPAASRAIRAMGGEMFSVLMTELLSYGLPASSRRTRVMAMPEDAPLPPIWILGSSGASARAAGQAGFGYSFASHFSPDPAAPAFEAYRQSFRPSDLFPEPHTILGVAVVCAETDEEADYLASSMDLAWLRISRGQFLPLPSPETALAYPYTPVERAQIAERRALSVIGSPETVRERIVSMVESCGADEVMVVSNLYSSQARLTSYRLLAQAFGLTAGAD